MGYRLIQKPFYIMDDSISDGYHTFDELYEHRSLLFIRLCLMQPHLCAWKADYDNWFLLYWESPDGQISYHCHERHLKLIEKEIKNLPNYIWDGHTSSDVLARLAKE